MKKKNPKKTRNQNTKKKERKKKAHRKNEKINRKKEVIITAWKLVFRLQTYLNAHITRRKSRITTSILFPYFINSFNEKLIFYHYNAWAHDTATKPRVSLPSSLIKKKKGDKKVISLKSDIPISQPALHWKSCSQCYSLVQEFSRTSIENNSSHGMPSIDMRTPKKMHDSPPQSTTAHQSVAEQAGLAQARLFANWNKVKTVYWIYLWDLCVCLNECLWKNINSSKQTHFQTKQPPLCTGSALLETRMEKK